MTIEQLNTIAQYVSVKRICITAGLDYTSIIARMYRAKNGKPYNDLTDIEATKLTTILEGLCNEYCKNQNQ